MEFARRLILSTALNVVALAFTAWVFDGVHVDDWGQLVLAGLVLGIVNALLKPIVTLLALPLIMITFGIALFFVSMLMLALTDWIVGGLEIDGFWTLVGATLVVWLVNFVLDGAIGVRDWGKSRTR